MIASKSNLYRREVGKLLAEGHEIQWVLIKGYDSEKRIFDRAPLVVVVGPLIAAGWCLPADRCYHG